MISTTLCHCGEPFYQTDDGLMCKKGHSERDTEKPLAEGGSTALPGSVPVGVTEETLAPSRNLLQAILPVGAFRTSDHRYYWNGKGPFPSVTTILNDVLSKHALIRWKSQEVARAIYRDSKSFFGEQWQNGEDAAVKWALAEADKQRDEAARIGSSVHLLADMVARHEGMPPGASESDSKAFHVSEQEKPYLDAFRAFQGFLEAQGARIVSSEHMVWSEVGYAGTYDLILEMPHTPENCRADDCTAPTGPQLWLVDIKTSKGVYPDYALQLAAYGHAEQIILEGSPVGFPMPKIDRYAVLHLRPDQYPQTGYRLWEYPITDEDYYRFISTLDLYLWRKEDKFNKRNLVQVT